MNSFRYRFSCRILPFALSLLWLLPPPSLWSQPYVEGGNTRHRFAQTYLGLEGEYLPGTEGAAHQGVPGRITPRITIGGLHFWGHADFYVSFPLPPTGVSLSSGPRVTTFTTGIETGARYYPLRIEEGRVSPFIGLAWAVSSYSQEDAGQYGPTQFRHIVPLQAGVAGMIGPLILEAGGSWLPGLPDTYPISRTAETNIDLPDKGVWLGMKFPFETTVGAEYAERHGIIDRIERSMDSAGQLNAFGIALGPSSAFTLGHSSYLDNERPFLDAIPPSIPFPDIGIGYYSHDLDACLNVAFRPIYQIQSAYGVSMELHRTSLSLEAYKFLFDYNGFVPFAGLSVGREWLEAVETDEENVTLDVNSGQWRPGIVVGWDIRPTPVDWFTLRTNLRYTIGTGIDTPSGNRIAFDQLEFNFIQFVLYPERLFDL